MKTTKLIIFFSLIIISLNQDYKTEQRIMLEKLKKLVNSGPSTYNENQFKDYALNPKSNTEIILDIVSYANRHLIKNRYRFPNDVMDSIKAAFMSKEGTTYEKIDYKKPKFTTYKAEYERIIGFAKKINDQVAFSVAHSFTNAQMLHKKQPYKKKHCWTTWLLIEKCEMRTEFKDRGYTAHELNQLQTALDTHNQINIRQKLNTIKHSDEIVISDKNKLYYNMIALGVKENGIVAVYETSSMYGPGGKEMANFGFSGDVKNAPYTFRVKSDGNIVVHDKNEKVIWETHTSGKGLPPFNIVLTRDYNVILLDKNYKPVWDRAYKFGSKQALIPDDYRILSNDRKYYVAFQKSDFGIYSSSNDQLVRSIWKIKGNGPFFAYLEKDGSFYIVDKNGSKVYKYENLRGGIAPFTFFVDHTAHFVIKDSRGTIILGF